jgi:hypothetical protein
MRGLRGREREGGRRKREEETKRREITMGKERGDQTQSKLVAALQPCSALLIKSH